MGIIKIPDSKKHTPRTFIILHYIENTLLWALSLLILVDYANQVIGINKKKF